MMNGKGFNIDSGFNRAMRLCIEGLEKNPDLIIHYDLESGWPTLITKEQQQTIASAWESVIPKIIKDSPPLGKVICFGTGGMAKDEFDRWEKIFKEDKDK